MSATRTSLDFKNIKANIVKEVTDEIRNHTLVVFRKYPSKLDVIRRFWDFDDVINLALEILLTDERIFHFSDLGARSAAIKKATNKALHSLTGREFHRHEKRAQRSQEPIEAVAKHESVSFRLDIATAIGQLSPRERTIVMDRRSGISTRETCERERISEAGYHQAKRRAQKKLEAVLRDYRIR